MTKALSLVVKLSLVLSLLGTWPRAGCNHDEDRMFVHYRIDIRDELSDPSSKLLMHCKSGTSEKGIKYMAPGEVYWWETKINYWRTTLYFCFTRWEGMKERYFVAFHAARDEGPCEKKKTCFWRVREDGIFFSGDNYTWTNKYPW